MGGAMQATARRPAVHGHGAGKYDVLSALALAGLGSADFPAQRALRLIALITTRYNWASDSLSVGHDELTRLWGVSRRTVIREIDALRAAGVLTVLRPGRKGRVTAYRLNPAAIRAVAAPALGAEPTGVDARLAAAAPDPAPDTATDMRADMRQDTRPDAPPQTAAGPQAPRRAAGPCAAGSDAGLWAAILDALPDSVSAAQRARWLQPLAAAREGDALRLTAESAFRAAYVARTYGEALARAARDFGVARIRFGAAAAVADAAPGPGPEPRWRPSPAPAALAL
jgi:DNA-binding transcriptional ArsR family regulator